MNQNTIIWFRRDLRLYDNHGLSKATSEKLKVIPIFIFDTSITNKLPSNDRRLNFIYDSLENIDLELNKVYNSSLTVFKGDPLKVFRDFISNHNIDIIFTNNDYEPYALKRDKSIKDLLFKKGIKFRSFKDQVIFEKNEIVKDDGKPYVVYTPFMRKWKASLLEDLSHVDEKKIVKNFCHKSFSQLLKIND